MHYYNEIDPYAAQWLRNLISAGHIPDGHVDERSIVNVRPADLAGFTQCHFFAGIAGWPLALSLAGWPADKPVWTGSCPCQPLSSAGKQKGHADERHLWPAFYELIAECGPATVFGEQVASNDGREWLAGVRADLEDMGYAVGAADLCAASAGAPHIRQRLFWVADSESNRRGEGQQVGGWRDAGVQARRSNGCAVSGAVGGLGNADQPGLEGFAGDGGNGGQPGWLDPQQDGPAVSTGGANFWGDFDVVHHRDGKTRRVEPGVCPLAHGVPDRVGKLRAYGNAIVPQVAAKFVQAFVGVRP